MCQTISWVLWGASAVWIFAIGPICWVLRDGLGPDAVESTGTAALMRFLQTYSWGPIALALVIAALLTHGWVRWQKLNTGGERGLAASTKI